VINMQKVTISSGDAGVHLTPQNQALFHFTLVFSYGARLYMVGRGIFASYESFSPSGCDWGRRNPQFAVKPRLPYTALLCGVIFTLIL